MARTGGAHPGLFPTDLAPLKIPSHVGFFFFFPFLSFHPLGSVARPDDQIHLPPTCLMPHGSHGKALTVWPRSYLTSDMGTGLRFDASSELLPAPWHPLLRRLLCLGHHSSSSPSSFQGPRNNNNNNKRQPGIDEVARVLEESVAFRCTESCPCPALPFATAHYTCDLQEK